jgi:hypothetical protein
MRALAESGFLEEGVGSILSLNSLLRQGSQQQNQPLHSAVWTSGSSKGAAGVEVFAFY